MPKSDEKTAVIAHRSRGNLFLGSRSDTRRNRTPFRQSLNMASEMGPHTEIIHDDMDTAMNDSLGAPHEAINEEIPEATNLDHNNVDSVNYNAEASYGNDLNQTANQFQHRE